MFNIVTAGALYAAPRILTHLYTAPPLEEADDRFYRIRLQISEGLHAAESLIGAHIISAAKELIVDNAWISYLAVSVICPASTALLVRIAYVALGSCMAWSIRGCLSSMSPLAARYIETPSFTRFRNALDAQRLEHERRMAALERQHTDLQNQLTLLDPQTQLLRQRLDFFRQLDTTQPLHAPSFERGITPSTDDSSPENVFFRAYYDWALLVDKNPLSRNLLLAPTAPLDPRESKDPILNKFLCHFTLIPPQNIVIDPNGTSFYERDYIYLWFFKQGTSPVTGEPTDFAYLHKTPLLRLFIAHRRDFLRRERENIDRTTTDANTNPSEGSHLENQDLSLLYLEELRAVLHETNIENFQQIPEVLKNDTLKA